MNNKSIGNKSEKKLLELISSKGYWCHLFADNINGQPCDVVALKGGVSILMDAKHCDKGVFRASRIEANQNTCFTLASSLGVKCGFALHNELDNEFYWLDFKDIQALRGTKSFKTCNLKKLREIL